MRFDAGKVENSRTTIDFLSTNHITHEPSGVDGQYQNPVERYVQTVDKGVAAMIYASKSLDFTFWGMALLSYIHSYNMCPNKLSGEYSPIFHLNGRHPNLGDICLFPFGKSVSVARVKGDKAGRFNTNNRKGIAVGSTSVRNGSTLVFFPDQHARQIVFPRLNVTPITLPPEEFLNQTNSNSSSQYIQVDTNDAIPIADLYTNLLQDESILSDNLAINNDAIQIDQHHEIVPEVQHNRQIDPHQVNIPTTTNISRENILPPESKRQRTKSRLLDPTYYISSVKDTHTIEFPTFKQAMLSSEKHQWLEAIHTELDTLKKLDTYDLIDFNMIPSGAEIVYAKLVLKVKRTSTNEYIKHKARLVILGNLMKRSVSEVFSPTASFKSITLLVALSVSLDMLLVGFDIYGAFLIPEIKRNIYLMLPKQLSSKPIYWKLKKCFYGLPDSAREFYEHLSKNFVAKGFKQTVADPCMFIKRKTIHTFIICVIHVDDILVAASNIELIDELRSDLSNEYTITESPSLESFIGIHLKHNEDNSITMSQPGFLATLLEDNDMSDCNPISTPISVLFNDEDQDNSLPLELECKNKFRSILGSLIFLLKTRPDISYAVNRLALRSSIATDKDMIAIKRILRYLKGTYNLGITFFPSQDKDVTKIFCWVDAAYGIHHDGKSHSGYCFSLGSHSTGMFYSKSYKQTTVALSSTEAEINPIADVTKEILWFRLLLSELGFKNVEPTIIYEDNLSAIALTTQFSGNMKRVKHFIQRIHFILEQYNLSVIKEIHINTEEQVSDILTKALYEPDFVYKRNKLMGIKNQLTKKEF